MTDPSLDIETRLNIARQRRRLRRLTNGFIVVLILAVLFKVGSQRHLVPDAVLKFSVLAILVCLIVYGVSRLPSRR